MDGSNAAFLLDDSFLSAREPRPRGGILYVEEFGADPFVPDRPSDHATPREAVYSAADLEEARQAGREDGTQMALADAQLVQAQLQSAALLSLADGLAAARAALDAVANGHAAKLSRALLAVLNAAVPATMRTHAVAEQQAMLLALLPGLTCEPELRVRAHPDVSDTVRETLITLLPSDTCVLSVCPDASLAPGDLRIAWQDGRAYRDTAAIWAQVTAALEPLGLPTLEELCRGC